MPTRLACLLLCLCLARPIPAADPVLAPDATLTRIAFGSCCHQDKPQQLWGDMLAWKPQLFLFGGDNVYADDLRPPAYAAAYAKLAADPGFARFRAATPILATWDDHDYGLDDAGADFAGKAEAKQAFLGFFAIPADAPIRSRDGIYSARVFGPEGRRVQVILLDGRSFRDPLIAETRSYPELIAAGVGGPYLPNPDPEATLLGAAQWTWLAEQLRQPAELRLIVSGIQFAVDGRQREGWANFPMERDRLYELIAKQRAHGVIVLSGDVHFAELSKRSDGPYSIYDFTSSGLAPSTTPAITAPWSRTANRWHLDGMTELGPNWGSLSIDWEAAEPSVTLTCHTLEQKVSFSHTLRLSELRVKDE